MILRRIAEHMKQQHWTGVFIELVIVILGVFIGLQANNWNQARADRGIVAQHLREIAEDLQARHDIESELTGEAQLRIAAVDYVYAKAFNRKLPTTVIIGSHSFPVPRTAPFPSDRLDHLMGAIDLVRETFGYRNGYESLISSGHLGLIQDKKLARAIQIYYSHYDDLVASETHVFWAFRNDGAALLYKYGVSEFDARPPGDIVAIARAHPDFAAYLRTQREWAVLQLNLLEQQDQQTTALLSKIHKELKRLK